MLQEVCKDGDGREDGSKEEVLGKQLALDETKRVARKVAEHCYT